MNDTPETDEALSTAECESDLVIKMRSMERELNEAREESIRWMSIAEGRGRTDDEDIGKAMSNLIRQRDEARKQWRMSSVCRELNDANERMGKKLAQTLDERDEWKAKYIQQNKDLGCELRDPNGTIWDHAKTLQRELTAVTAQRDRLAEALRKLADCDWVITLPDRMDAVRTIANEALQSLTPNTKP
jgi:hypothetical protein